MFYGFKVCNILVRGYVSQRTKMNAILLQKYLLALA
jgi:hypothetical protein